MCVVAICLLVPVVFMSCSRVPKSSSQNQSTEPPAVAVKSLAPMLGRVDACSLALAPHRGSGRTDQEIVRLQAEGRKGNDPTNTIERLGWMYVRKARESFDPGFYKLAEQCALCLDTRHPHSPEALLLRGHVLHNLHHFKEAEVLARALVMQRGLAVDQGLLGDALMEQGRLGEAVEAYQKMVDLRPDLHSYARAAHLRWLKGDLKGAIELMQMAARAGSPHDGESAAWAYTRLAFYQSLSGALEPAQDACASALEFQTDYAPALLLRGRLRLAQGENAAALDDLQRATQLNPLPEYQWALAEALRGANRNDEAIAVESTLRQTGAGNDPRTFALYLATRSESIQVALQLAEKELLERGDVFTHDAHAWALAAAGRIIEAQPEMARATSEGTMDARLFFHAMVIASKSGRAAEAKSWFARAEKLKHLLLPSERDQLLAAATGLQDVAGGAAETARAEAAASIRQK